MPSRFGLRTWLATAPAIIMMTWGGNQFTPLLLLYRQAAGFTGAEVDLFLAFYIVGLIPAFLLAGPFSDRHGRKTVMFIGLGVGVIASVVLGVGSSSLLLMCAGRLLSGLSVAVAMVVGTSWIKELSSLPFGAVSPATGARRAALTITIGLGLGAGVGGVLAQWGPYPLQLPYLVQILGSVIAAIILIRAPQTHVDRQVRSLWRDLRIPAAYRRRFLRTVVPLAPWVFSAAALAYAVGPSLVQDNVAGWDIAFATLLTVVTLGAGAIIQPFAPQVARLTGGRPALVGIILAAVGTMICALVAITTSPVLAIVAALVLGLAYGLCLVSGLTLIQSMATADDLGGLTGIYYSLTYVGFALPVILATLSGSLSYPWLLLIVAALAVACAIFTSTSRSVRPKHPLTGALTGAMPARQP